MKEITNPEVAKIQKQINKLKEKGVHVGELSDTYHSFDDLYDHRAVLTAALFRHIPFTWKSKIHEDGSMFHDMFIVGVCTPDGMATYHYDLPLWDLFKIPAIPCSPPYDGHTPEIALERLKKYFCRGISVYSAAETNKLMVYVKQVTDTYHDDDKAMAYINNFIKM